MNSHVVNFILKVLTTRGILTALPQSKKHLKRAVLLPSQGV